MGSKLISDKIRYEGVTQGLSAYCFFKSLYTKLVIYQIVN